MFWKLYDKLTQVFCRHEWKHVSSKSVCKDGKYFVIRSKYQCQKCGKVKYKDVEGDNGLYTRYLNFHC